MKKTERLHHMLRFINQKQHFTLPELMQEFQISKRTALRDIASLEEMGAPIYVEYGRYGGYRLLQQMQLPPISFNTDELHALYFAMQALRSFSSLPFQTTFDSVHQKFMAALSDKQRDNIHNMQQRVTFKHTEQIKDSSHLELLLMAAVQQQVIQMTYSDKHNVEASPRIIQPIALYASKGYWYCQAYDLKKKAYRVFRCDRMITALLTDIEPVKQVADLLHAEHLHALWKPSEQAISFQCKISEAGMELFRQNYFPSMHLEEQHGMHMLVGTYESHELDFIVSYLASYGTSIQIVAPDTLKESLRQHYLHLLSHI
ncbi:putative DNA-binding transcriptional regulator YafY [Paenibacillus sp. JGP012]|uniref:helix-turn-helix transcriptional regulator n=1 Tax=Paenibacillus sp. JGP012 TaxID=2735914 RepID=UPI00161ACE63|nr:YafY family protein [Paenibacillus sp. JGP012]MBB6020950.1 putative DNA-binding transcriptional regulator YafY [Paenibacillus sp. JGP012]